MSDLRRLVHHAGIDLVDRVRELEHIVASCLLSDPFGAITVTRSAGLCWRDFMFDPYSWCMRAAIAVVDGGKRSQARFMIRLVEGLRDKREQSERLEIGWLWMEAPYNRPHLATAANTLANIARQLRIARSHQDATRSALNNAWREAFGQPDDLVTKQPPRPAATWQPRMKVAG